MVHQCMNSKRSPNVSKNWLPDITMTLGTDNKLIRCQYLNLRNGGLTPFILSTTFINTQRTQEYKQVRAVKSTNNYIIYNKRFGSIMKKIKIVLKEQPN